MSAANWGILGGGGAKYFFFGAETSTKKYYSKIIIFVKKLRISHVIPRKCLHVLEIARVQNASKITSTNSQGIIFVIISCPRVKGSFSIGGSFHKGLRVPICVPAGRGLGSGSGRWRGVVFL